jgi:hypothetical protein
MAPALTSCCLFSSVKMGKRVRMRELNTAAERKDHTAVGHVEQSARSVSLHTHVLASGEPSKRDEGARLCNLGLVIVFKVI